MNWRHVKSLTIRSEWLHSYVGQKGSAVHVSAQRIQAATMILLSELIPHNKHTWTGNLKSEIPKIPDKEGVGVVKGAAAANGIGMKVTVWTPSPHVWIWLHVTYH